MIRPWHPKRDRSAELRWPAPAAHERSWFVAPAAAAGDLRMSWAVEDQGVTVGRISLREMTSDQARLGIYLSPLVVGRGLGTQALQSFLPSVAFCQLGLQRVVLDVAALNQRAVRCYRGVGFRQTGQELRGELLMLHMERTRR
jgi:RimJ/RimL family protein N-acetyltransferase